MATSYDSALANILYAEDSLADILLTEAILDQENVRVKLHSVRDGAEAMHFLQKEPPHTGALTPDLIVLDLNMPRMNGHEVLKKIKNDTALKNIPVAVLSGAVMDRAEMVEMLDAVHYMNKPLTKAQLLSVVSKADNLQWQSQGDIMFLCRKAG